VPTAGTPPPSGLREFISALDRAGLLTRRTEAADCHLQIGQLSRDANAPLLFERIKDYPGHQLFTGGLASVSSMAVALGLEPATTSAELVRVLKDRLSRPQPTVEVKTAPSQATCVTGSQVRLYNLPVPWWSEIDAGRYVGTWHLNITKDPTTGKRNAGIYRMQILNENQATVSVSPRSHLAQHMELCERARRPLEMAVAIGVAEPVIMAASAALPFGTDELEAAGGFMTQPVPVARCRTVDLEAPANAEIVLEGKILPGERVTDGPYLDYAGVPSTNPRAFRFEVTAITAREQPVFRGMAVGRAGAEDHQLFAVLAQLGLVDFHGSNVRQRLQNVFLRRNCFRLFQWSGRLGYWKGRLKRRAQKSHA
jgi:UbiD family decarboxylase